MEIKKKNIIISLILALILFFLLAMGVFQIMKYYEASKLCDQIARGEHISTDFSNGTTSPKILAPIYSIMQTPLPRIPLVEACKYKHIQAVKVLLNNGADPNFHISQGKTSLEAIIRFSGSYDCVTYDIINLLLLNGCDVNLKNKEADYPPAYYVAERASNLKEVEKNRIAEDILYLLLDNGCKKEYMGYEPIMHISACGVNTYLVRQLVEKYNFNVNGRNPLNSERSPLIVAVNGDDPLEMVKALLCLGADKNIIDANGKTALDYAMESGNNELIQLLS